MKKAKETKSIGGHEDFGEKFRELETAFGELSEKYEKMTLKETKWNIESQLYERQLRMKSEKVNEL